MLSSGGCWRDCKNYSWESFEDDDEADHEYLNVSSYKEVSHYWKTSQWSFPLSNQSGTVWNITRLFGM